MSYIHLILKEFDYLRRLENTEQINTYIEICRLESKEYSTTIEGYEYQPENIDITSKFQKIRVIGKKESVKESSFSSIKDYEDGSIVYSTESIDHLLPKKQRVNTTQTPERKPIVRHAKSKFLSLSPKEHISCSNVGKSFYEHYSYFYSKPYETHYNLTVAAQRAAIQARQNEPSNPYIRIYYTAFETNRRRH
jgi:hypothetical protein